MTVEALVSEALTQIPLYTKEWTNFNPSEPGITILEQLSGASVLQQQLIDEMAAGVQKELLNLVGFPARELKSASVLLKAEHLNEDLILSENQQFHCGELVFEVPTQTVVPAAKLVGVYSRHGDTVKSHENILHREMPLSDEPFGASPQAGAEIYFIFDNPFVPNREIIAYLQTGQETMRNQPEPGSCCPFASIEWSYYTKDGFVEMPCQDQTFCLLLDGELRFRLPKTPGEIFDALPQAGYAIRGKIKSANYDVPPKLRFICFGLFEVWQRHTKSLASLFSGGSVLRLHNELLKEQYLQVFCRERRGENYHLYQEYQGEATAGRFFSIHTAERVSPPHMRSAERNGYELRFPWIDAGYGPTRGRDNVCVVAYSEEMMRVRELGYVYGYDNQMIELPVANIVPETFSLIVQMTAQAYDIVPPGRKNADDLCYDFTDDGNICIQNAGRYLGAKIFLGGLSVTMGANGNILPGNILSGNIFSGNPFMNGAAPTPGVPQELNCFNPASGRGGRNQESMAEVRQRFRADVGKSGAAVLADDYETIVKQTPGLCFDKVRAFCQTRQNVVNIAVKPSGGNSHLPFLSETYREMLRQHLEQYRLLSTSINILEPIYVPVDVSGSIYVKKHYENCRKEITAILNKRLDYVNGSQQFGELLSFSEVFQEIEKLEGVEYIYELSFSTSNTRYATRQGADIKPGENCLCYPGRFQLQINTYNT